MLLTLMDTRLFGTDGPSVAPGDACPRRGLCAKVCGEDYIILDTFARKGRHRADVAALQRRPRDQRGFVSGKAKTVDSNKLEDIGPRYDAVFITENKRRKVVYMPVESPTSGGTEECRWRSCKGESFQLSVAEEWWQWLRRVTVEAWRGCGAASVCCSTRSRSLSFSLCPDRHQGRRDVRLRFPNAS